MLQETEMREFFNRIIGDFTGLTEAANKVEGLSQRLDELSVQLQHLQQENDNLKREVKEAWEYARTVEDRANGLQGALNDSQASAKSLQETIVMADSRVTELTQTNEGLHNDREVVIRERDEARNRVTDYEVYNTDLKQQLEEVTRERDQWRLEAEGHSATIKSLTETVSRVQSILNPNMAEAKPETNVEFFPQSNVG